MSSAAHEVHFEITQLLHRYARAVDTGDWELYRSLFTEDAVIDYTSAPGGSAGPRDDIIDWLASSLAVFSMTAHHITNVEVDLTSANAASVRAMFFNPLQLVGSDQVITCGGVYEHTMRRDDDGWRSTGLTEHMQWFHDGGVLTTHPAAP